MLSIGNNRIKLLSMKFSCSVGIHTAFLLRRSVIGILPTFFFNQYMNFVTATPSLICAMRSFQPQRDSSFL